MHSKRCTSAKTLPKCARVSKLRACTRTKPAAAILRYAPGASVPEHEHESYEHVLILDGEQCDDRGAYGPGSFVVNPPGSRHAVSSPKGCLALLIWLRPVRFSLL